MRKVKRARIYVTAKDIREGVPANIYQCPLARAFARWFKRNYNTEHGFEVIVAASVNATAFRPGDRFIPEVFIHAKVTDAMTRFMRSFDVFGEAKPTSFVLRLDP
jgi:hypothetical protein